ncbi:serine-protein kinase RsbW [Geminocystis sp. NIES-3708]|uniref:ATP-binding protein n=1 Tax=Geminocystis sp. NIES-3708 TaxID=1615909 RepID=UPI0005FCCAE7|nr:ATP-binding protein [Geminocystis sp. NIES-3708]BAQ61729.1 serine-protein kinase RsbW [Geminocystis sp. NIES-3708]
MMIEKLTVSATLDSLKNIAEYVAKVSNLANLDKKAMYKLRLAIDELATNIISYAYSENNIIGDIFLESEISDQVLSIKIKDSGIPFDPTTKLDLESETIDIPIEERKIGGLGIFLAFDGVDEFSYERINNENVNTLKIYHK